VVRVGLAPRTVLFHLDTIGIILLILLCRVIAPLAVFASKRHQGSHVGSSLWSGRPDSALKRTAGSSDHNQ